MMEEEVKKSKSKPSVKQDQIHDILFNREIGWKEIIYDLINTEQLDPWDIDITILSDQYLQKIQEIEETDFFVSSKVLLAAALLLRIKSEILLNQYIKSIDEILFGTAKPVNSYELERIELDEDIPGLIPKSPLPRFKRVTLNELMESLNKAILTENRRIRKEIVKKNAIRESLILLPKKTISIKDKIREVYENLLEYFKEDELKHRVSFNDFIGQDKEERIISFYPLLQLDSQKKIWLEQEEHLVDFHIWMKETYFKHNPDPFAELKHDIEEKLEELDDEKKERLERINKDFENPLGELFG